MFSRVELRCLADYFVSCPDRKPPGVYFCRLTGYSEEIHTLICRFIEVTRQSGVCISQKIGNPDEKQLAYYEEIMGLEFQLNPNFFVAALKKWLPRVNENQRLDIANCFYDIFVEMARKGKNENMQRNAYVKFMCWLYYKFEPVLHQLGSRNLPKILIEGDMNQYELNLLTVLSRAGCDILILEYTGDGKYREVDPDSALSQLIEAGDGGFPPDYSILELRRQMFVRSSEPELKMYKSEKTVNTNTWIQGNPLEDSLTGQVKRGADPAFFYNLFAGIYGAEEPSGYYAGLLKWKLKADSLGIPVCLVDGGFPSPTFEEIGGITRKNYSSQTALLNDMALQIHSSDRKLQLYAQQAFMECMADKRQTPVNKLMNLAVVMVVWLNRYMRELAVKSGQNPVLVYYGAVKHDHDACFLVMLSKLPIDVLVINPEGEDTYGILSPLYYQQKYQQRVEKHKFPMSADDVKFGTVAYQAERELDTLMYQDTGMYRNQQFQEASPILLQVTFEEISILWHQEAKYRPNFETFADRVMVPVIFSKVSGISGTLEEYWNSIANLMGEKTYLIPKLPFLGGQEANPFKEKAYSWFSGSKLDFARIKSSSLYPFAILRDNMQDFILKKLQELIDSRDIAGTGRNGTENLIVATVFNMDKKLLRLIQNYDFTRQIPKVVVLHTEDTVCSVEDSILLAYLNRIGFDVAMFVPTGYTGVERHYTKKLFTEHQIGEFQYDLRVPNLNAPKGKKEGFVSKILRRGR